MSLNPFADDQDLPDLPDGPGSNSKGKVSPAQQGLEIPADWRPTAKEPVPVVRCSGTSNTTGERCKKWSLRGTTVCRSHGGALPTVRETAEAVVESARMELMGMADDAVEVIRDLMKAGVADQVRLKAAENVLNRTGIKDAEEVKVEVTHVSSADTIAKRLEAIANRMKPKEEELEDEGEIVDEPEKD